MSAPVTFEPRRGGYVASTDPRRLDRDAVYAFLTQTYWAAGMPRDVFERAVDHSLCFGVYHESDGEQVGFARAITDRATYAYLSDVFIVPEHGRRGLGKWLVESILAHPDLQGLRRITLYTRDAQGLYARFGFGPPTGASTYMELRETVRREG